MAIPNPNPNIFDGAPRDNKTYSSAMIEKKISEGGGGSSVVPDPAVADIGKVLGIVSDGSTGAEYGAVSISSPKNTLYIDLVGDDYEEELTLPDGVTCQSIYEAITNGYNVIIRYTEYTDARYLFTISESSYKRGSYQCSGHCFITVASTLKVFNLSIDNYNAVSIFDRNISFDT